MTWILDNRGIIADRTLQHLRIALLPILLSFVISVPIGWLAHRYTRSGNTLLGLLGLLYAVPSLPLFIVLPALLGTGLRDTTNVVVALVIYGVALMARATTEGLRSVDPDVRQAGSALGYSAWSQFWRIEFPLAGPVLLAGIRVVAVSTISLATVGSVLGIESLGLLFTDGIQRDIPEEIGAGIVMTVLLAIAVDFGLVLLGRFLMPWNTTAEPSRKVAHG
jgi:osmoprotectant transport system permease protein